MTVLDAAFLDDLARHGPIGKTLGMLVRTAFVARSGRTLVWGDWSAIEARVLPWLAASPGAEAKLAIFRESDKDPNKPDVYVSGAARFLHVEPQAMWDAYRAKEKWAKDGRQSHGKVPELSLGYGGGLGALQAMAIGYGVFFDEETARQMVSGWRENNQWARDFWGKDDRSGSSGLWGAVAQALRNPGDVFSAGRVAYVFDRSYLDGTLFCALPCGRLLSYPSIRWRTRKVKNKLTDEVEEKTALWFKKGYGWAALWYGKLANEVTQATAASILRETLVELAYKYDVLLPVVGHTHDEIVAEPEDAPGVVAIAQSVLKEEMEKPRPWRADLPVVCEISENWFYTKAVN